MAKISSYENYTLDDGSAVSSSEQETFEETGVIPVSGQYVQDGTKKTKSVKLKDLLTSGGSLPDYSTSYAGEVLTLMNVNGQLKPNWNPTSWPNMYGKNGITVYQGSASVDISISTSGASDGDVLTYNGTTQKVAWAAGGGGGGGSGWTKSTIDVSSQALQDGAYVINIPSNNTLVIVTGLGTGQDTYDVKIIPPTVGSNEVINCAVEFTPVERDEQYHTIEVDGMSYSSEYYSYECGSGFSNESIGYQITMFGSFWKLSRESDE